MSAERRLPSAEVERILLRIEHIGSTSVPGLAAKPIVDVLVTVADAEVETELAAPLEQAGYLRRVR